MTENFRALVCVLGLAVPVFAYLRRPLTWISIAPGDYLLRTGLWIVLTCALFAAGSFWLFMRGRVASLLEVGTGFHPELSGRENIFLNGSILGMRRREIAAKFDDIVAFAEVEKFLDTPVKRYSSGMYVRLAFAVAAHLDPEILIVDEVLAVGDAEFQRRCLGKMKELSQRGARTVLFVSHNMSKVLRSDFIGPTSASAAPHQSEQLIEHTKHQML